MEGSILVTYIIICDDDVNASITVKDLIENEKFEAFIKREYAKGLRNVHIDLSELKGSIYIGKKQQLHTCTIDKADFADALSLAEDDAKAKKLLKGKCQMVELIDIKTVEPKKK